MSISMHNLANELYGSCFWWVRLSNLLYLTLVSLFLTGTTKKSWEKGINNHLTTVARQSWNDICMFRHSKSAMLMTFVCFGIAKLECQMLNIIGYFFSLSYILMHDLLKMKNMQRKIKSKKIKILYIWLQACLLGDVEAIGCTSKVIVPIK